MSGWHTVSTAPQLCEGEVHIWQVSLDVADGHWQVLMSLLPDDEQAKASRFHFVKHRRRHTVSRAALRTLLGQYLKLPPPAIEFTYNAHGKPRLADERLRIKFNVSHTEEIMLVAFAIDSEVGVDIESVLRDVDYVDIGKRWFSPLESRTLLSMPENQRIDAFFRAWSRKEAYIKARGEGMSHPLCQFTVTMDELEPRLIEHQDDPRETSRWRFIDIDVAQNYQATVVVESSDWKVNYYRGGKRLFSA
jgi:4'-phosphopantetheinyl transferase